ncbi:hemagglutinin protein [Wellfleet Bay virus]|uniref:Hemagglutinin protein n=1 Tax=Wellfleet Bay virus TaxID=1566309 RepID=A0A0A1E4K7_9ORTO|nr:hemagglutinin protein [Wellfleet Bay virus]AIY25033.1 hemagglutinin protein [Wellfleet Bay virus]
MLGTLLLQLTFVSLAQASPCSSESCAGPYKLGTQEPLKIDVKSAHHRVRITKYPTEIDAHIGYRSRYTAYCYSGGAVDPNTGCDKIHRFYPPNQTELKEWVLEGKCSYGVECKNQGDCWGSDAALCFDRRTDVNKAETKEFDGNNEEYYLFPHHACISTWRCGFHKTKIPIHVKKDGLIQPATYGPKGEEITLDKKWYKIDSETIVTWENRLDTKDFEDVINCFEDRNSPLICQLTDNFEEYSNQFVEMSKEFTGVIGPYYIQIEDHNGSMQTNGTRIYVSNKWATSKLGKAASLEDVKGVILAQIYTHSETVYNLVQVAKQLTDLQEKVIILTNSVSKLDDELMGQMVGILSRSKWFNKELFYMCPCFQINDFNLSNCAAGFTFTDGRITEVNSNTKCTTYSDESVITLYPFKRRKYEFSTLQMPPVHGAAQDWEGWSWLASQKQNLINSIIFRDEVASGTGKGGVLNALYNQTMQYFSLWSWLEKFTTCAAWLALLISVINFMRK